MPINLSRRLVLAHRGWRYRTRVDPDEIRWMRSVLKAGDSVVDIGAYKGGYTYWMRRGVGEAGTVLAFEPQPRLASYLRRCVRAFRWRNVYVDEAALSSEPGTRPLRLPDAGVSPAASLVGASLPEGAEEYDVHVDTLDAVMARRSLPAPVRLIKCDVEGHELEILRGAEATLERDQPNLLFECEQRHLRGHSMADVFGHLEGLGYRGFFFWRGQRLGVDAFDVDRHQVEGRRPYANNFAFTR